MTTSNFTDNERSELRSIAAIFNILRRLDSDMTMNVAVVLLWVARNEGRTQVELRQALDMASTTASRSLATLSNVPRPKKEALGLIEWRENPEDRRQKLLFLSPKGRHTVHALMDSIR